jgi:hypothetical protein
MHSEVRGGDCLSDTIECLLKSETKEPILLLFLNLPSEYVFKKGQAIQEVL